jgi:formylglycine-generating enzyme required for sulfatase activity
VIAMRSRINDQAAADWAGSFYEFLVTGEPVDAALSAARWAVQAKDGGVDWSIPVLYMRAPDGRIFDFTDSTPSGLEKPRVPGRPIWKQLLAYLGSLLVLTALGLGYWFLSTRPPTVATTSDLGCPSPPGLGMGFAKIPPGEFIMGSESGPKNQQPIHKVQITKPYCMGKLEVTQKQWKKIIGKNPSKYRGDSRPVERVSWDEIQEFLRRLNLRSPRGRYRLPTEAEWEHAARADQGGPDPADLYQYGNCLSSGVNDGYDQTAPVGRFKPNAWGLYDMFGNVSEWVNDRYEEEYSAAPAVEPQGPGYGEKRVRRGGNFGNSSENCNASFRTSSKPDRNSADTGFRIVRDVED